MIVKQTRILFECTDILALRIECEDSRNERTLRLTGDEGIPDDCPMCKKPRWIRS